MFRLTRRHFMGAAVATAAALEMERAARALGMQGPVTACTLTPEQEQGPFYVASTNEMLRSNIAENRVGVPLELHIAILETRARLCTPVPTASVELWHCDAMGLYSHFTQSNFGPPPESDGRGPDGPAGPPPRGRPPGPVPGMNAGGPPPAPPQTDALTFLRGIQMTGWDGTVRFRTVFPGFYPGRTNHIHFKVRIGDMFGNEANEPDFYKPTGHVSHVGQIFFPEDLVEELMSRAPYNRHKIHRTTQAADGVFNRQGGAKMIAKVAPLDGTDVHAGLSASIVAGVDTSATPAPVGFGGPRRDGPPPTNSKD
jgi:protocatechuate 3,4-dioxygenase beta subunit